MECFLLPCWPSGVTQKRSFFDEYVKGDCIGQGSFGNVFKATKRRSAKRYENADDKVYAVKIIEIASLNKTLEAQVHNEIQFLKDLKHPRVVKFYDDFVDDDYYYIVTEYLEGGDLYDRIYQKWEKDATSYNEKYVRDVCKVLLEAVDFLHENNVAHLDLKPDNLLLESMEDNALIKIADFGLSQKVTSDNNCLCGEVGTKGYQAPEVITKNSKYGTKADMFSIGVIAYTLLRGSTPFCSREHPKCRIYGAYCIEDRVVCDHRVLNQEYKMEEEPYWHHVSFEAKDMVRSLLVMDPNQRLSAKEALAHKWMSSDKDAELEAINLSYNFMAFETYNRGRRNLRKFAHAAQAVIKMRKSISNATTQTSATGIESNGSSSIGFMGGSTCTDNTRANGDRDEMCRVCDSFDFEVNHFSRDEGEKDERDRAASTVFYDGTNRSSENEFIFPFDP